jgi:oxygen-dependent protoporphyrinogen oxidase
MQQLADTLVESLAPSRVQIHYRSRVEQLFPETPDGWAAAIVDEATGDRRRETFAGVVVATPAYQAAALLGETDPQLTDLLNQIPYAGCVVVNLAFERDAIPHPLDSFGFIVPHVERRSVLACTFCSVKYAERAPEGKVLLRVFLGGGCRPEVLDWSDERVLQVVRSELQELLRVERQPLFSRITRWQRSMPQYHLGHVQRVKQIEERVEGLSGLELAGNAYRGVGIPHCIHSGQQASDRLAAVLNETHSPLK